MQISLTELQSGQKGVIYKVSGKDAFRRRMHAMGIIKGAVVAMVRSAPLGDPIEITVKGYHVTLRRREAMNIYIEKE